jgi:hypothetical protein
MNPITTNTDPVIAVHDTHGAAEASIKALSLAGFDMKKLSIIGKGYRTEEHAVGFYTTGDRVRAWGAAGGFWGAIWGLLVGPAVFVLPPVGLVAVAGPIALALVAAFEGAVVVGGVSALCGALASIGLSREQAIKYEADIVADRFLVIVHGSQEDIDRARAMLAAAVALRPLPFHQAA